MNEVEIIYSAIRSVAKDMNLEVNNDESQEFEGNYGIDISISINENTLVKFFKFNADKLYSYIVVGESEYAFNLIDYTQREILEINFNYVDDVKLLNFISNLQRKLGSIPKKYVAPTRHKYVNGKLVY